MLLISLIFEKFKNNLYVTSVLDYIRPVTIGLLVSASILLITPYNFIDAWSWILFGISFAVLFFFNANPFYIIIGSAVAGLLLYGDFL